MDSNMGSAMGSGGSDMGTTGDSGRGLAPSNPAPDAPRLPQTSGMISDDIVSTPSDANGVGGALPSRSMGFGKRA